MGRRACIRACIFVDINNRRLIDGAMRQSGTKKAFSTQSHCCGIPWLPAKIREISRALQANILIELHNSFGPGSVCASRGLQCKALIHRHNLATCRMLRRFDRQAVYERAIGSMPTGRLDAAGDGAAHHQFLIAS
jgi:hypothetical protein